jgi:polysaccharide biosynthesis transport protein
MRMWSSEGHSRLDDEKPASPGRGQHQQTGGGRLDPRNLWLILRWRVRLVAATTLATVALTVCALVILPPKYKATTIVLVDPRQPQVTKTEAVLSGIGADVAAVESQVELIASSALAGKVIAALKLADDPELASPSLLERVSDGVLALFGRAPAGDENTKANRIVDKFLKSLTVRRRGLTYVLEISYVAKEPAKAAEIANAVAEAYLDDQRSAKGEITARASDWLGDRITEMRERVRRAEEAVAAYRSAHNLVDVTQGNKLINRQVEDLTLQIALARTRTADARARLERVQQAAQRNGDPATLSEALQSQVIANLRSQYAEAARLEAEYSTIYGNKHPGLIAVRAQVADLRRQIENEIGRIRAGVHNEYQTAVSREAALEGELTKLKQQSAAVSEADVKLRELEREAQANRMLFEQFLNRVKETSEQQTLQIADARVVAPALAPLKPDRPGTLLLLAIAACGGLILSVLIALILEETRRGFRSLREVSQLLSLPGLGMLPRQAENASTARRRLAAVPASPPTTAALSARFALDHPHSPYAKNLRAVCARLLRSSTKPTGEILVVMSALPGEGKSTFACNFARAAEDAGVRTLLIDGDVYTAASTRIFGLQQAGLTEVLGGKISFWNALAKDPESGLHVLGARDLSVSGDAAKDIHPARLASFLREFSKLFDLIVIDTPAILRNGDGAPHIECADRAVLLVEWDHTERQAVADALDTLDRHAGKLTGVVLNKVSPGWCRLFDYGGSYLEPAADAKRAA